MLRTLFFLLTILIRNAWPFTYSCDEVKYKLMHSGFGDHSSKFLCVVKQEKRSRTRPHEELAHLWSNPDGSENEEKIDQAVNDGTFPGGQKIVVPVLATIYAEDESDKMSFANISDRWDKCVSNDGRPWQITADSAEDIQCSDKFTIIFTDIKPNIQDPSSEWNHASTMNLFTVIVSPRSGIWLKFGTCQSPGNITIYTGVGTGEEERRYKIGSFICYYMPRHIFSFDNALTVHFDRSLVSTSLEYSCDGNNKQNQGDDEVDVYIELEDFRVVIFSSGRSEYLRNRIGSNISLQNLHFVAKESIIPTYYFQINMQLLFDASHTSSRVIVTTDGKEKAYYNGDYAGLVEAKHFSITYEPHRHKANEESMEDFWRNEDSVFIEFTTQNIRDTPTDMGILPLPMAVLPVSSENPTHQRNRLHFNKIVLILVGSLLLCSAAKIIYDMPKMKYRRVFTLWNYDEGMIEKGALLGNGSFGQVFIGKLNDRVVAIKTPTRDARGFLREAELARHCSHPNVLETIGICTSKNYIITEYLSSGNLKNYLEDLPVDQRMSPAQCLSIAVKVASGMDYLASKRIIHRDLAARNILVGETINTIKISDFGLARNLNGSRYYYSEKECFSFKWTAPEAFVFLDGIFTEQKGRVTSASDVWSFGVLMWELYSHGKEPFPEFGKYSVMEFYEMLTGNKRYNLNKPEECPDKIYAKLLECWSLKKNERPTFPALCEFLSEQSLDERPFELLITELNTQNEASASSSGFHSLKTTSD